MGFRTGDTPTAFNAYVMGLRRAGLPFSFRTNPAWAPATTSSIATSTSWSSTVALALESPSHPASRHRQPACPAPQPTGRSTAAHGPERDSGLGAPETVIPGRHDAFKLSGIYLDLGLMYVETGALATPPRSPLALAKPWSACSRRTLGSTCAGCYRFPNSRRKSSSWRPPRRSFAEAAKDDFARSIGWKIFHS